MGILKLLFQKYLFTFQLLSAAEERYPWGRFLYQESAVGRVSFNLQSLNLLA